LHSPKNYWEELKVIMADELQENRIDTCSYGFFLWHVSGRNSWQPLLDNGYVMIEEDGVSRLKATCEQNDERQSIKTKGQL
jgi:hypothetical protein